MLVLSRHKNETIEVGDDVVMTVVEIRGDKVRIGVEAPKVLPVHRGEVAKAIREEGFDLSDPRLSELLHVARGLGDLLSTCVQCGGVPDHVAPLAKQHLEALQEIDPPREAAA